MGRFNFNPVLSEIQSHMQAMSPAAQAAVKMANPSLPSPEATAAAGAQPMIHPGMLLPHPESGPPAGNISMDSPSPLISMPSSTPQLVTGPKRGQEMMTSGQSVPIGTTAGDTVERQRLLNEKPGVDNIYHNITTSGFGQNHPFLGKLLGGVAEVGGKIGDTLLNAAPGIAREIPGSTANHNMLLNQANTHLGQDLGNAQKEATTANTNATAGKTAAETAEAAPEAEAKIGLEQAQTSEAPSVIAEHNAQAANLLHPQAKTDFEAWQQQNPGKPIEDWLKAQAANKTGNDFEQYYKDFLAVGKLPDTAQNRIQAREKWAAASQAPQRAPMVNLFVPNGQGGETLQTVRPGQTVAAGAQTAAGINAVNTPTMQQRTAAGRAGTVVAMAPEVLARIDAIAPKLGPMEGRWNEFMQGKVGMDDPDFAALRSDLLMMSSAVALAHAQGRLPENLRLEFDNAINSPKQTPANLKATITAMLPWLQKMQDQAHPNQAQPQVGAGSAENWVRGPDGKLVKQ